MIQDVDKVGGCNFCNDTKYHKVFVLRRNGNEVRFCRNCLVEFIRAAFLHVHGLVKELNSK